MNECGLNIIFFSTFSCYFQYLFFVTAEKRNKNKQKMGFDEFFLQEELSRIPVFEKFCGINFCECLSLKNFAGLIFEKRGEIRKNKYRKNLYGKILSHIN